MKSNVLGLSIMAALLAGLSTQAYADPALTVKAGTLGVGVDLGGSVVPGVLNLRGELNGYTYDKYSFTSSNVNYNTKLKLQSAGMLADWYPFQGSFRLTGGLYYDNNKLDLNATPTNGSYTINGHSYTSQQVGNLAGRVSVDKTAPYVGVGWGNPVGSSGRWTVLADLGALYQGSPKVSLNASGAASNPQLASDVEAARQKAQSDLAKYKWYPVASVGLAYNF